MVIGSFSQVRNRSLVALCVRNFLRMKVARGLRTQRSLLLPWTASGQAPRIAYEHVCAPIDPLLESLN